MRSTRAVTSPRKPRERTMAPCRRDRARRAKGIRRPAFFRPVEENNRERDPDRVTKIDPSPSFSLSIRPGGGPARPEIRRHEKEMPARLSVGARSTAVRSSSAAGNFDRCGSRLTVTPGSLRPELELSQEPPDSFQAEFQLPPAAPANRRPELELSREPPDSFQAEFQLPPAAPANLRPKLELSPEPLGSLGAEFQLTRRLPAGSALKFTTCRSATTCRAREPRSILVQARDLARRPFTRTR